MKFSEILNNNNNNNNNTVKIKEDINELEEELWTCD